MKLQKKMIAVLLVITVAVSITGCSEKTNISVDEPNTISQSAAMQDEATENESTITEAEATKDKPTLKKEKSTNPTTTKPAVAKSEDKTTTTQTTTKKHTTTTRPTTTFVQTTALKETTTKKVTTTKAPYWCDEGGTHHSCEVGVGGWISSYDEAVDNALEYIEAHDTSGNFTVQQCLNCGKYTVYVSVD